MDRLLTNMYRGGLAIGSVGLIPYFCLYNVDGGERVVMFNRFGGVSDKVVGEGTHFMVPWFQKPFIYDIRARPKTISTTTGTRDLQTVNLSLRLLYRPAVDRLPVIHKTLGADYDDRVLPSFGNEVMKAIVAQYDAESLLTKREMVSKDIRDAITRRCSQFDIILDDVAITHLNYGKEFAKAIEEKQVAEQEAERIKFVVAKSEQERLAAVVRAEGEATAAEMISKALKDHGSGLLEIRRIEAAKEIADTLARSRNVMYVPGGMNMLMNLGFGGSGPAGAPAPAQ
uniref:Prohibitin n=1 Tax=Chromera velia CCMP2878 TaxID=1169474 RepID=A0A0G4HNS1_9ALVE|mmetsp:Transcript_52897/g.103441  ORF Transcript_52897/g.103441 Transcript_52897/m.103441 type:complete len:285 (-) Transcript_52897:472-1326(-)|eukprot:Cvel_29609.t1-p1 / transcript=Cvel_29609.t1 / gene=Cvel_29609 / organism=Chromera_velia_CCMP2878 / gene_product=Prohibitin-4, mitochondrial, putative / transcript_product=Prohibitin-4, mitochondrial, putative / location=Cvel_scaffold4081:4403-9069(+) / protein_length=284 / sequence_SO=supercontig / SO=protein_coding / is_pseudo=false